MSVSQFIHALINLALLPFREGYLFLYCASILMVGYLFRIVFRLTKL